jgi:hypothetical protein
MTRRFGKIARNGLERLVSSPEPAESVLPPLIEEFAIAVTGAVPLELDQCRLR